MTLLNADAAAVLLLRLAQSSKQLNSVGQGQLSSLFINLSQHVRSSLARSPPFFWVLCIITHSLHTTLSLDLTYCQP